VEVLIIKGEFLPFVEYLCRQKNIQTLGKHFDKSAATSWNAFVTGKTGVLFRVFPPPQGP